MLTWIRGSSLGLSINLLRWGETAAAVCVEPGGGLMAARLLVHHPLVLQTFGSFWLPAAEAAVQFAGSRDGGKTNGGRSRVTLYNSAAPDSALAGAERWPPSAPLLLLLPLLRRVDLVFSGYFIRGFGDYKSFTVLPCRRSCPRPRTRGSHAVCLWFVTVCTSVCVCV